MTWYARPSLRLVFQLIADALVVLWCLGWWWVSRLVDATIRGLAAPAREAASVSGTLKQQLQDAANQASTIPIVGDNLRGPFENMSGTLDGLGASALGQAAGIEQAATLVGIALFALPVLMMLALWLPPRLRFATRAAATKALAQDARGVDLLALRALANRSIGELAPISADPMGAWRSGDRAVIERLADLELASAGVRRRRRATPVTAAP